MTTCYDRKRKGTYTVASQSTITPLICRWSDGLWRYMVFASLLGLTTRYENASIREIYWLRTAPISCGQDAAHTSAYEVCQPIRRARVIAATTRYDPLRS